MIVYIHWTAWHAWIPWTNRATRQSKVFKLHARILIMVKITIYAQNGKNFWLTIVRNSLFCECLNLFDFIEVCHHEKWCHNGSRSLWHGHHLQEEIHWLGKSIMASLTALGILIANRIPNANSLKISRARHCFQALNAWAQYYTECKSLSHWQYN